MKQRDLWEPLLQTLDKHGDLSTEDIYKSVASAVGEPGDVVAEVGVSKQQVNLFNRTVRWAYQSLKRQGFVSSNRRGYWYLTGSGKEHLTAIRKEESMVAFRTDLGICLWADASSVSHFESELSLICVSPPYPLLRPRSYGNPTSSEFTEWLVEKLKPAIDLLKPGGSLVLNLGQDVYEPGRPVRSDYLERTVLALTQECGLRLHDRIPMINRHREPGPTAWSLREPYLMRQVWEPIYWFSNRDRPIANNRAILKTYTKSMEALIARGGEASDSTYPCGRKRRAGSYANDNGGSLPTNVFDVQHATPSTDKDYREYADACRAQGLPIHPARMPIEVAETMIRFLTRPGDWVADVMAGSLTTCHAAELLDRRWLGVDLMREFLQGAATRFKHRPGYVMEREFKYACSLGQQSLF